MKKTIFLYGLAMALLVAFLKAIEYRYFVKRVEADIYMGAVAIVFMGLGIWVAWQFMKRREVKIEEVPAGAAAAGSISEQKIDHTKIIEALEISQREMDVLQLMAEGHSNQEIADKLFISIHTVKTHSSNLFSKLQVKRRTQAVQKSKEIGLLSS
ncbi:MAG: LuxR C-terminal-related transcriptional regulator [Bacteroidota bacterium]